MLSRLRDSLELAATVPQSQVDAYRRVQQRAHTRPQAQQQTQLQAHQQTHQQAQHCTLSTDVNGLVNDGNDDDVIIYNI